MNRIVPALIALALTAGAAFPAQPPGALNTQPYSPQVLNPYLNLLHRGNPAINYYGIVRPQIEQNEQLQRLQYGLARTEAEVATPPSATAPGAPADTGHSVGFMNYTRYFNTINARGR